MTEIIHQKDSYKGQNGKVLVISGSKDYYGASVLCGLACFKSGVDLVHLFIPEINRQIVASFAPEFIIKTYNSTILNSEAVGQMYPQMSDYGCVLIGPGLTSDAQVLDALRRFLPLIKVPIVLDADGLNALESDMELPDNSVITPHRQEIKQVCQIMKSDDFSVISSLLNCTVLVKGTIDYIIFRDNYFENTSGNESMTKGGTGDILAGIIAGLVAQGLSGFEATKKACLVLGNAGDELYKKKGYSYLTSELISQVKI
jgi:ADP-dependent NAD(P)H-hydrate dehydratase / NAD(P)H-hydrate epimerase